MTRREQPVPDATTRRSATGCSTGSRAASSSASSAATSGSTSTTSSCGDDKWDPVAQRHGLRLRERDPHDAGRRGQRGRVAEPHRPAADHGLQHGRRRPLRRRTARSAARRVPRSKNAVPLDQPHARAPEPRLHDGGVHAEPAHREPGALRPAARRRCAAGPQRPDRGGHRRALRPGERAAGQPGHDRSAGVRRARRRRPARSPRARTTTRSRRASPAGETIASVATTRRRCPRTAASSRRSTRCATRSASTLYRAPTGTTAWAKVRHASRGQLRAQPVDDGAAPLVLSITDTARPRAAPARRRRPTAPRSRPYAQNAELRPGARGRGHPHGRHRRLQAVPEPAGEGPAAVGGRSDELPEGRLASSSARRSAPCRATRRTSTTTSPTGPTSSTSTTGSTRRRRSAGMRADLRGDHLQRRPRPRGRSTSTARRGSCSAT